MSPRPQTKRGRSRRSRCRRRSRRDALLGRALDGRIENRRVRPQRRVLVHVHERLARRQRGLGAGVHEAADPGAAIARARSGCRTRSAARSPPARPSPPPWRRNGMHPASRGPSRARAGPRGRRAGSAPSSATPRRRVSERASARTSSPRAEALDQAPPMKPEPPVTNAVLTPLEPSGRREPRTPGRRNRRGRASRKQGRGECCGGSDLSWWWSRCCACPAAAVGGGYATDGLQSLPTGIEPGEPWKGGSSPCSRTGARRSWTASRPSSSAGRTANSEKPPARLVNKRGVYRARVVFREAGRFEYVIDDGYSERHTFPPVTVGAGDGEPAPAPCARRAAGPAAGRIGRRR